MIEILRFEINVPAEVALKDAGPGKPIEGRYGNRVMYTLADDRVMYVAPIVASRISELRIQPGELFNVCKQVKREGTKRLIEWQVERLSSEPETKLERELSESVAAARAAEATRTSKPNVEPNQLSTAPCEPIAPSSKTPSPSPSLLPIVKDPASDSRYNNGTQPVVDTHSCSQETPVPPAIKNPAPALPLANGSQNGSPKNGTNPPPVMTKLEHALRTAISAAYNAEKYGAELGYVVRFDVDAIKSMAITVLINMSEGGRR